MKYTITGIGLTKALQQATDEQKELVIARGTDPLGKPIILGYYLVPKGEASPLFPTITRFKPNEIRVTASKDSHNKPTAPILGMQFQHTKVNERHFLLNIPIDESNRLLLRNIFRITKKATSGFVIQVELTHIKGNKVDDPRPIVRYDHAHGFIHRDMIAFSGSQAKYKLDTQDVYAAITFAIDELRDNLCNWLQLLGYIKVKQELMRQELIITEMNKAKVTLLKLCHNPSKIREFESTYFHLGAKPGFFL
ncbi:MAG: hypothetical protein WB588_04675 [Dehalococcoidia bacterium]